MLFSSAIRTENDAANMSNIWVSKETSGYIKQISERSRKGEEINKYPSDG
jgi:hypothetical protein